MCALGNRASQRVAEKLGAEREGLLRNRLVTHDALMLSLTPEWLNAPGPSRT